MSGNLLRPITTMVLAGLVSLAPVAPVYGQQGAATPPAAQTPANAPPPYTAPAQLAPAQAQTQPATPFHISLGPDYSITAARKYFPNVLLPYRSMHMDDPQFANSPRMEQLIQNGQLRISLEDTIELALENNLDISVQRYNSWLWETDILRAEAGNTPRGNGATATNLPIGNNPLIAYDPTVSMTVSLDSKEVPVNNPIQAGNTGGGNALVPIPPGGLYTHTEIGNIAYTQGFETGTTFTASWDTTRQSTTSTSTPINPNVATFGEVAFTQQLLNGFGLPLNRRYIQVAKIGKKASDYAFMQSVLTDVTAAENDYWELYFARNNVDVQQRAVDLAQRLFQDNQRQVEVGTLAPIEVVRAQAQIATAQQALVAAQTTEEQDQEALLGVITKDPLAPAVRDVEIVPTDSVQNPPPVENIPLTDAVNQAMTNRPDVLQSKENLQADDISVFSAKKALLPSLVASGYVNSEGLSGNRKNGNAILPSGWAEAAAEMFNGNFPEYEAQVALNIPIRNRSAEADATRALLTKRQDQEKLEQTYNTVAIDVHNAQITLQQARAEFAAAQKTRELQDQTLAADQTKFQVGAATVFEIVTDESNLEISAGAEQRALADLAKAQVNWERAMGQTLTAHNITIADAQTGQPGRDNLIPGTSVAGQVLGQKTDGKPAY